MTEERVNQVEKELSGDVPPGQGTAKRPGFRTKVMEILADGEWYSQRKILTLLRQTFSTADLAVVRNAINNLRQKPPSGKEVLRKKVAGKSQYRMRDAVFPERQVPTALVTTLVEGLNPILQELKHWARQNQFEIAPSALGILAVRLEKLMEPFMSLVDY